MQIIDAFSTANKKTSLKQTFIYTVWITSFLDTFNCTSILGDVLLYLCRKQLL